MSCPDCGAEHGQVWENGYSATHDTPAEPEGWLCTRCGYEYAEDFMAGDDAAYEQQVADELEAA